MDFGILLVVAVVLLLAGGCLAMVRVLRQRARGQRIDPVAVTSVVFVVLILVFVVVVVVPHHA